MGELKWEDVDGIERTDVIRELEYFAESCDESAVVHAPRETLAWQHQAAAVRAAIRKLRESDKPTG